MRAMSGEGLVRENQWDGGCHKKDGCGVFLTESYYFAADSTAICGIAVTTGIGKTECMLVGLQKFFNVKS